MASAFIQFMLSIFELCKEAVVFVRFRETFMNMHAGQCAILFACSTRADIFQSINYHYASLERELSSPSGRLRVMSFQSLL